jgi:hypothetical protein
MSATSLASVVLADFEAGEAAIHPVAILRPGKPGLDGTR